MRQIATAQTGEPNCSRSYRNPADLFVSSDAIRILCFTKAAS